MGNLFCKQTSSYATSDLSKAIDPTGTDFLHEGLMSLLSVPFYHQHREDLRYFLIFGISLGQESTNKCYPHFKNAHLEPS